MILAWLEKKLRAVMASRPPDYVIGGADRPYMRRWWVIPRNHVFNIYLHEILRSDDDRALHDHPWLNCSILISGHYVEHTIADGGINVRKLRGAGTIVFRTAKQAHRLEIAKSPALSLFLTGPVWRSWGFHCPNGWRHWRDFTTTDASGHKGGVVGRGCD